jgi:hypothetical protein
MNEKAKDVEYSPLPMQEDVEALHVHHKCRHNRRFAYHHPASIGSMSSFHSQLTTGRNMLKKLGLGAAITVFALTNLTSSRWSWKRVSWHHFHCSVIICYFDVY